MVNGEIDFCRAANAGACAKTCVMHLRTFSHNWGEHRASHVKAVSMRSCDLSTLSDSLYRTLLDSLAMFTNLQRLRVSDCKLSHVRLISLMKVVKSMPNFIEPNKDAPLVQNKTRCITWSELAIGGNEIDDHTFTAMCKEVGGPLLGVGIVCMMNCRITDESVINISRMFPSVRNLFLCNTRIEGTTVAAAVGAMQELNLLGMDSTLVSGKGCTSIVEAMQARKTSPTVTPLEVWLRKIVPCPDDKWIKLLDFSSNARNSRNASNARSARDFVIKHDFQVPIGSRPRYETQVYDLLTLRLRLSFFSPFVVVYEQVACTRPIMDIAKEAVDELNMVALGDEKEVKNKMVMRRKMAYREVFADLFAEGYFYNRRYVVGVVQMSRTNKFTRETEMTYAVDNSLLGVPRTDTEYSLDVEADEVAPFVYNGDGALVEPKRL